MSIRWAYALRQWKPQFDDFVRREDHARALKTISIAGFSGVELFAGTGRWEPFGNPAQVAANFGSLQGFLSFLADCAVENVSSWTWDPHERSLEHLSPPLVAHDPGDRSALVERARWYAEGLAQLGGSVLVVSAALPAWHYEGSKVPLQALAECWNEVGAATTTVGVRTALRVDFLSPFRQQHLLDDLVEQLDPAVVGLSLDTGELAVSGVEPGARIRDLSDRVWHVHLRDALEVDVDDEYLEPHAEYTVRLRGGARAVPRWFGEPGSVGGRVDTTAVVEALVSTGYDGWVVVDTSPSPHPATSALLSAYRLAPWMCPAAVGG